MKRRALIFLTLSIVPATSYAEVAYFSYDGLGRLVQSFQDGGLASGTRATTAYDATDNRSRYTVINTIRTLRTNQRLYSSDNRFYLTLQSNGQLAILTASGGTLWTSGTATQTADRAAFQTNGNLAILNTAASTLWQTATNGNLGATLNLQNDGNLVILSSKGTMVWQSNTGGN